LQRKFEKPAGKGLCKPFGPPTPPTPPPSHPPPKIGVKKGGCRNDNFDGATYKKPNMGSRADKSFERASLERRLQPEGKKSGSKKGEVPQEPKPRGGEAIPVGGEMVGPPGTCKGKVFISDLKGGRWSGKKYSVLKRAGN